MMKLTTLNLNGIRSASAKGLWQWVDEQEIDCLCVQELKAQKVDVVDKFEQMGSLKGYFHFAQQKGYSGVGIYTKKIPSAVIQGFDGGEFDAQGRCLELQFDTKDRKFSIVSIYFPSGSSSEERQAAKYRFLDIIMPYLVQLQTKREFIICSDVNIAHQEIDLKNYKGNVKNSGFLPQERAWLSRLLNQEFMQKSNEEAQKESTLTKKGLINGDLRDVYRQLHPSTTSECYTWWSNRGQARAKNVGWRIDYHLATPAVAGLAKRSEIYKEQRFSDHAPLTIEYDFDL